MQVKKSDHIYDLAEDHTESNPKLRRLKNPHLVHEVYQHLKAYEQNLFLIPVVYIILVHFDRVLLN